MAHVGAGRPATNLWTASVAPVSAAYSLGSTALSSLLFTREPLTGALLFGALWSRPLLGLGGLVTLLAGRCLARFVGISDLEWERAPYGPNLLLVGVGLFATFAPSLSLGLLAIAGVAGTVLVVGALRWLERERTGLPPLILPYLIVAACLFATGRAFSAPLAPVPGSEEPTNVVSLALASLGALIFAPQPYGGTIVLAALLISSRIAAFYAAVTALLLAALLPRLAILPAAELNMTILDGTLTALALGTVWFVPSRSSLALGLGAAFSTALMTLGLRANLATHGVSLGVLPFHLTVSAVLLTMRLRARDDAPKCVDFEAGTPQQNLRYHAERIKRFVRPQALEVVLPFRGTWVCTQGVDGAFTHREQWRHAWDFEVVDTRGSLFQGTGERPQDYHCYGLPVLAAAAGTVVAVESSLPDSPVGFPDLLHPFGNHVVVYHAPGTYSLVAHLAPDSVQVAMGEAVTPGTKLGKVGASGRSPRPHLHFSLQAGPSAGSATLPMRFANPVWLGRLPDLTPEGFAAPGNALAPHFEPRRSPSEGDLLRPLSGRDNLGPFGFLLGERVVLELDGKEEVVTLELTLLGGYVLTSSSGGRLHVGVGAEGSIAYDSLGPPGSVVHLLRACLPRLPGDDSPRLTFDDLLPEQFEASAIERWLSEFVAPFRSSLGRDCRYERRLVPGGVVLEGQTLDRGRPVTTRAVLSDRGLESLELRRGQRAFRAARVRAAPKLEASRANPPELHVNAERAI